MTLARDLSDLPRAETSTPPGVDPDPHPRFVGVLADAWDATRDDDKPTALGTRVRHSDAGRCARAIAYTAAGIPRSDPMDLTGVWNTSLGTLVHDRWQDALRAAWPTAEVEVTCGWDDLDASGHIDAVITIPCVDCEGTGEQEADGAACPGCLGDGTDRIIAYELKTIGGYGYKAAVGRARRGTPAEGPKAEHIAQAALNGLAVGADEVIVGYLAKECISVNQARGLDELARFAAEWTFTREQYEPIAVAERDRMRGILALVDDGILAARKIPGLPDGAEIVDPTMGRWEVTGPAGVEDTGTWWSCGYCAHRTVCATTGPGRIPIDSVRSAEEGS